MTDMACRRRIDAVPKLQARVADHWQHVNSSTTPLQVSSCGLGQTQKASLTTHSDTLMPLAMNT